MSAAFLSDDLIEQVLARAPSLTVGVLGDLFLDRYLDIDAKLTEPSLETGLDAYQVVKVRSVPGAAGTVINNLVALGVGKVCPIAIIGDDGEGHELRQALRRLGAVDAERVYNWDGRRTPTYTKPMLFEPGKPPRELNRLDIKNRSPLPPAAEDLVLRGLDELWPRVDALLVLDQVSEEDCGVITSRVREALADRASADRNKFVLADSRERIGSFPRHVAQAQSPRVPSCHSRQGGGRRRNRRPSARGACRPGRLLHRGRTRHPHRGSGPRRRNGRTRLSGARTDRRGGCRR